MCVVLVIASGGTLPQWLMIMAPIYLVVAIIVAVCYRQVDRMHQAHRRTFLLTAVKVAARRALAPLIAGAILRWDVVLANAGRSVADERL